MVGILRGIPAGWVMVKNGGVPMAIAAFIPAEITEAENFPRGGKKAGVGGRVVVPFADMAGQVALVAENLGKGGMGRGNELAETLKGK